MAKDFGQKIVSCPDNDLALFTVGCVGETSKDILLGQIRKIVKDFLMGHARSEIFNNVVNGNSHPPDARFRAPFSWFDGNNVSIVHAPIVIRNVGMRKCSEEIATVGIRGSVA